MTPELRALVAELHGNGYSVREIARQLNAAGIPTPGRSPRGWQTKTVARALGRYS